MPLDSEQVEYLRSLRALPGLSEDETVTLVATFALNEASEDSPGLYGRLLAANASGQLLLGVCVGQVLEWEAQRSDQPDARVETHPDLTDLEALIGDFERVPDVTRLHRFAQASLLSAIQRAADAATTADELRVLADAYLTLPVPGEDDDLPG